MTHFLHTKIWMNCTANTIKKSVVYFAALSFALSPLFIVAKTSFAQTVVVSGGTLELGPLDKALAGKNVAESTITAAQTGISAVANSLSASLLKSLGLKEWALDGVAYALAKMVIKEIARSTVAWINSGFQGSPMFMTDPGQFMLNVADRAAGDVIYGSSLRFLCSPINIQIALNLAYTASRRNQVQCTISGIGSNVQSFIQGNFVNGGWTSWFSVNLNSTNSTLGSGISAAGTLSASISSASGRVQTQTSWGRGFLSREECTKGKENSDGSSGPTTCRTVTPGDTIAQALSFETNSGQMTLIEADEINEIIGALLVQVVQQGLTAASGLFNRNSTFDSGYKFEGDYMSVSGATTATTNSPGYTRDGRACSSLTYIEQMSVSECSSLAATSEPASNGVASIEEALSDELTYQAIYKRVINGSDKIITEAKSRGTCSINDPVISEATDFAKNASSTIATSQVVVKKLESMKDSAEKGNPEEKLQTLTDYGSLITSGQLHEKSLHEVARREVKDLLLKIEALNEKITTCPRVYTKPDDEGSSTNTTSGSENNGN